jgi:hypothetical protein|nr:hypothetical protein [uncultured Emticicia sp.]
MSVVELKTSLHNLVDRINNDTVLQAYLVLLSREVEMENQKDFWLDLDSETKSAIEQGLGEMQRKETVNAFDFMKEKYGI